MECLYVLILGMLVEGAMIMTVGHRLIGHFSKRLTECGLVYPDTGPRHLLS